MEKTIKKYLIRHKIISYDILNNANKEGLFVVIPAYLEQNTLPVTLESLRNTYRDGLPINIIVVVNCGKDDPEIIRKQSQELYEWCIQYAQQYNNECFKILTIGAFDFDSKSKGAGIARKTGMDQVVAFCDNNGLDDTVIISMDADSTVEPNYFIELNRFFNEPKNMGCSIKYAHPLEANEYDDQIIEGITLYELHLRYYIQCLKASGFPYAFHTVGSSMAFRMSSYVKAGGMTKKQAGEDFYMIHKLVLQGGFKELNTTTVFPSPRSSDRVIFGTGATIKEWLAQKQKVYYTYNIQSFIDLKELFTVSEKFFKITHEEYDGIIAKLPGRVRSFLVETDFWSDINHINANCSETRTFAKRFFEYFSAFKVIKYLNFVHRHFIEKSDVIDAATKLLETNEIISEFSCPEAKELLEIFRGLDMEGTILSLQ